MTHQMTPQEAIEKVREALASMSDMYSDSGDDCNPAIDALRALTVIEQNMLPKWQDISTALLNTRVILTFDFERVYAGEKEDDGMFYDGGWGLPEPTHWMPLPPRQNREIEG